MRRRATARSRPRRRANDRSCGLAEMRPARRGGAFLESRYRAGAVARSSLLLVLVLVLFLFLVLAVMVVIIVVTGFIVVFGRFQRLVLGGFAFLGLLCLTLARSLVVFIGIEQQVQPRHHLFDRRQLPGRAGFAARTGFASCAGLALRAGLAARALRTGLARRTRLAARTFRSGPSGMALRSGPTRFAAWALRPLPSLPGDCIVCHGRTPDDSQLIVNRRLMMASIERRVFGDLINNQSSQRIKPETLIPRAPQHWQTP